MLGTPNVKGQVLLAALTQFDQATSSSCSLRHTDCERCNRSGVATCSRTENNAMVSVCSAAAPLLIAADSGGIQHAGVASAVGERLGHDGFVEAISCRPFELGSEGERGDLFEDGGVEVA